MIGGRVPELAVIFLKFFVVEKFVSLVYISEFMLLFVLDRSCSQVFCWLDRWHGMTMQDIRRLEDETREELDRVSD